MTFLDIEVQSDNLRDQIEAQLIQACLDFDAVVSNENATHEETEHAVIASLCINQLREQLGIGIDSEWNEWWNRNVKPHTSEQEL